jgi:hypothetical protein
MLTVFFETLVLPRLTVFTRMSSEPQRRHRRFQTMSVLSLLPSVSPKSARWVYTSHLMSLLMARWLPSTQVMTHSH